MSPRHFFTSSSLTSVKGSLFHPSYVPHNGRYIYDDANIDISFKSLNFYQNKIVIARLVAWKKIEYNKIEYKI